MWDEITYPFLNFNDYTVGKWISSFIPHFMMDIIIYPYWDLKLNHVNKRGHWWQTSCQRQSYEQEDILLTWINFNPSMDIHHKRLDESTYPFPNLNGCIVEVWEWISNFIRSSELTRYIQHIAHTSELYEAYFDYLVVNTMVLIYNFKTLVDKRFIEDLWATFY